MTPSTLRSRGESGTHDLSAVGELIKDPLSDSVPCLREAGVGAPDGSPGAHPSAAIHGVQAPYGGWRQPVAPGGWGCRNPSAYPGPASIVAQSLHHRGELRPR